MTQLFNDTDIAQFQERGIDADQVTAQIEIFKQGVAPMQLVRAATIGDGIQDLEEEKDYKLLKLFDKARDAGRMMKMVPASGAASRMFKDLLAARDALTAGKQPSSKVFDDFVAQWQDFAFAEELKSLLAERNQETTPQNLLNGLLNEDGLNYANKPKGLLSFHRDGELVRTPIEEHFVEAAAHVSDTRGKTSIHFTVSSEHKDAFEEKVTASRGHYEGEGLDLQISYSVQKPSTDTVAVDLQNNPFRDEDQAILFRPGGHGALIENLNDLKGDIIFIKNIDNVVPDHLKGTTLRYKRMIAGYLLKIQKQSFDYLENLDQHAASDELTAEILEFIASSLGRRIDPSAVPSALEDRTVFLHEQLNRPLRVCGMVKNQGEPGGGPFWTRLGDAETIQIVESSQIDTNNADQANIMATSTHFNPVDLVCAVRNYKGEPFDLLEYIDHDACFISEKSYQGRDLKALELPGLWNGAMAKWNTSFVEVPLITFNPVKIVMDLLRPEHR